MGRADEIDYYTSAPSTAVGLDFGAVLTKVFRRGAGPVVRPTPSGPRRGQVLADLLRAPDRVGVARPEGPAQGLTAVLAEAGVRDPVFVRGLLCVAATHQLRRRMPSGAEVHIVCDTGARSTAAAACVLDGDQVRLIAAEHAESPDVSGVLPVPADWLAGQSVSQARRANVVLGRAMSDDRYRSTPVYFGHDRQIVAGDVLRALEPITGAARTMLARLVSRVSPYLDARTEVALTGVFGTMPPVHEAVLEVVGQRPTRLLEPTAVAEGALLVAEGKVSVAEDYPHTVGLAVRRIHRGLLESAVLTIAERGRGRGPVDVHIADGYSVALPVRLRVRGDGPWLPWTVENGQSPAPGRYSAEIVPGRATTGVLVLRPVSGAAPIQYPLTEEPGGRR